MSPTSHFEKTEVGKVKAACLMNTVRIHTQAFLSTSSVFPQYSLLKQAASISVQKNTGWFCRNG